MSVLLRAPGMSALLLLLACSSSPAFALGARAAAAPPRRAAVAPARNLLANPGFEKTLSDHEWMPAGWDTSDAGVPTVFFGRDSFMVHSGRAAVNIANTSMLFPMSHNWNQTLLVGPETWGKTAVLSFWARSNGLEGRAYIMLQAYRDSVTRMSRIWGVDREQALRRMGINKINDELMDLGWKRVVFSDPNTDWVRREARVYIPQSVNVLFVRAGLFGNGQVLFDDASLTLVSGPPPAAAPLGQNLLADESFEQGGDGWDFSVPPYEGARLEIDTTVAHTGRASARLSTFHDGLVQARMGITQPLAGSTVAGKRVRLTAWVKGDSLGTNALVKIYAHSPQGLVLQSPGAELLSGTFDWTRIAIELDVPKTAVLVWPWVYANAPGVGRVWFDDVRFEALGPSVTRSPGTPPRR